MEIKVRSLLSAPTTKPARALSECSRRSKSLVCRNQEDVPNMIRAFSAEPDHAADYQWNLPKGFLLPFLRRLEIEDDHAVQEISASRSSRNAAGSAIMAIDPLRVCESYNINRDEPATP